MRFLSLLLSGNDYSIFRLKTQNHRKKEWNSFDLEFTTKHGNSHATTVGGEYGM